LIIIYLLLALIATTFGAMAGLGGGVIIKPALDALGHYDLSTISILSSATVFSMAIISTIKQIRAGFVFEKRMYLLAFGAIIGGGLGKQIFSISVGNIEPNIVKGTQGIILAFLLIIVLFKDKLPKINVENTILTFTIGIILGLIAAFLGIGGGPINVAILCMLLGFKTKDAAVISIFIILFSQLSKLFLIAIDTGFSMYDLKMLWVMIPGGIFGGIIGSKFNRKLTDESIDKIFKIALLLIIGINIYNVIVAFSY